MKIREQIVRASAWQAASLCGLLLAGCGGSAFVPGSSTGSSVSVTGRLMGGQQPIQDSAVQLYAAGSTGYGSGATALGSVVSTDANGNFSISSDFTCPSSSSQLYLVSKGGNPGTGSDNSAILLMTALGACGNLGSLSYVTINELSTVASAWALSAFLAPDGQIGSSATNAQGLANAFTTVNNLVNLSTGTTPGSSTPANAVLPTAKINTLADILAVCVNSGSCSALFAAATPANGSAPTNTLDAALNIARHPASNAAALFAIPTPTAPFQPTLASAPADWTLAVSYAGGGLDSPDSIAVDAAGNVWAANYFGAVTELSTTGEPLSSSSGFVGGGLDESYGIAVDKTGTVWVTDQISVGANNGHGSLTVFNSSGELVSGSYGYYGGGVYFPVAVAADSAGNIWSANYGNSTASLLSSSGTAISASGGWGAGQLSGPVAVAVDANRYAWFANQSADNASVSSISPDGSKVTTVLSGGSEPSGLAIDALRSTGSSAIGHLWTANYASSTISTLQLNGSGSAVALSTGYSGGGLNHPNGIAVDGAGNVWAANFEGNSLTELQGAGSADLGLALSPSGGFGQDAHLGRPYGVAIDASGNLWVSNFGLSTITEFVGAATPVQTPLTGPALLP